MASAPSPIPTLDDLDGMARAYQQSAALLTAVELDLFTAVGDGGLAAEDVAERLGTDTRATEILLNALTALGILSKSEGLYRCGAAALRHLIAGTEEDSRATFLHAVDLWKRWSRLTECVQSGQPAVWEPGDHLAPPPRTFIGAMHSYAQEQAAAFVGDLDLTGVARILDLGGGSGAYAIAFCQISPDVTVTVFDVPNVIDLTREYIEAAGVSGRIALTSGDMRSDDFGDGYDLIWLSNVLHAFGPDDVRAVLHSAADALVRGGRIVLRDFIMDEQGIAPVSGAVFALNMLVNTRSGGCYSQPQYSAWLQEAGFAPPTLRAVTGAGATAMLEARKV